MKNCTTLKREVQSLSKDGKLKFEESDGPVGVRDLFEAKVEMIRQEEKAYGKHGPEKHQYEEMRYPSPRSEKTK